MTDVSARPERLGWVAAAIGLLLLIGALVLAHAASCTALLPAAVAGTVVLLFGLLGGARTRFLRREANERIDLEHYRREQGGSELFTDSDEAVKLAERASRHYVRFFVPALTVLTGAGVIVIGFLLWLKWNGTLTFPEAQQPLRFATLAFTLFLGAAVAGSYYVGVSREPGCRWLRPCGAWLFFVAVLCALAGVVLIAEHVQAVPSRIDVRLAKLSTALLLVLGAELVLNFVIEFYRPRTAGEEERPLYESRLLALLTEPGGIARNVATSLDYQFGFRVSEVWFYRFLERTVIPFGALMILGIWLQTCLVVVNAEENGIRERFGRVVNTTPLGPGLYFKLPAPFARIYTFAVDRVQEIPIGYIPAGDKGDMPPDMDPEMQGDPTGRVVVWSKAHMKEETSFIVASEPEFSDAELAEGVKGAGTLPVTVYFLSASVPLYFKVKDLYQYAYVHREPLKTLEELATREVVHYLATVDFFAMLTEGRAAAAATLKDRIQTAADDIDLGIDVVFVGMQGMHPPVTVGSAFDEVVAAMEEKHEEVLKGDAYRIRQEPAAEGAAITLVSRAEAYRQERVKVAEAEAGRFRKQLLAYDASPNMFVLRSFLDVLENEGAQARKYVVATGKSSEVFVIDLQEKLQSNLLDLDLNREE